MAAGWTHGMTVPLRTFARAADASRRLWQGAVGSSRYGRALTAGLAVAVVLLLATSGYLAVQTYQRGQEEQRRQDILAAARQTAVNFTSLDYRRYAQDSQNVLKGATGDFKRQFKGQTSQLTKLVAANKSVSQGRVIEAGIARAGEHSARVLVVADSKVTNAAVKKGQVRNYRLQLDLVLEHGRWMTSDVEFVG
jgi:Mce-associated membrane protein